MRMKNLGHRLPLSQRGGVQRSGVQTFPAHVLPLQEKALVYPQGHACLVTGPSPPQEGHSICQLVMAGHLCRLWA